MLITNMLRSIVILLVFSPFQPGHSCGTWDEYPEDKLPRMYAMEDYLDCNNRGGSYCKADLFIRPNDQNTTIALQIQKSHKNPCRLHRSSLFRMMCVPHNREDIEGIKKYIKTVMEDELLDYDVNVTVSRVVCQTDRKLSILDYFYFVAVCFYAWLIYKATTYDIRRRNNPDRSISKYDKWLTIFSIRRNLDKALTRITSADYQKLRSIQGMRFYVIILVVTCHTKLSIISLFVVNPRDLEQVYANPIITNIFQSDMFLVQIFFMISTLLLTNQIYELHQKRGYFSLADCWNLFINRILRFLPTILFMMITIVVSIKMMPSGTMIFHQQQLFLKGCNENWWATALQCNYLFKFHEMCIPGTWYTSTDTLFYLTTIFLLYIQLKLKLSPWKMVILSFVGTSLNFAYTIYSKDFDIMARPTTEHMREYLDNLDLQSLYFNPSSSWNTCCIGIGIGTIFFHTKNKKLKVNKFWQLIWLVVFLLLPVFVVTLSLYNFHGIKRAIIGPLLKPTFALAFGVGILGMSHGYGGFIKKLFEWEFAVKMSNFTYCVYIFHFAIAFSKGGLSRNPFYFDTSYIVFYLFLDLILSFTLGIFTTLVLEMPWLSLQKMFIPQIKKTATPKLDHLE